MLDERKLKRKVALRLLGSPLTVMPFILGMTAWTATWALGWKTELGLFAGLAGLLVAGGGFVTRLLLSGDRVAEAVSGEMARAEQLTRQASLDDLDKRLTVSDDDPRPEAALRDLRALVKTFEDAGSGPARLNARSVFDIQSMARRLFDQCVHTLRQTEMLWQTANRLSTAEARVPILAQREALITDVQGSIKQLSNALVALQTMGAGEHSSSELGRIRDELDESLAVAKRVEERMSSFIDENEYRSGKDSVQLKQQEKG